MITCTLFPVTPTLSRDSTNFTMSFHVSKILCHVILRLFVDHVNQALGANIVAFLIFQLLRRLCRKWQWVSDMCTWKQVQVYFVLLVKTVASFERTDRKVLLISSHLNGHNSFHFSGHTLGFLSQTQKLEPPCTAYRKVLLSSFHLDGHTLGFHPQTQKLKPPSIA